MSFYLGMFKMKNIKKIERCYSCNVNQHFFFRESPKLFQHNYDCLQTPLPTKCFVRFMTKRRKIREDTPYAALVLYSMNETCIMTSFLMKFFGFVYLLS